MLFKAFICSYNGCIRRRYNGTELRLKQTESLVLSFTPDERLLSVYRLLIQVKRLMDSGSQHQDHPEKGSKKNKLGNPLVGNRNVLEMLTILMLLGLVTSG